MKLCCRQSARSLGQAAAIALTLLAGSACPAAGNEAAIQSALQELDSESIEAREKGAIALRAWAGQSPDRLLGLISADASPEQRERLITLARDIFVSSPRGALGVSFGFSRQLAMAAAEEQFEEGIPIDAALPRFDSANVLKGGDLLRSIDGCRVRTNVQCQLETISRDKGQVVQLEIEREGKPMRVSVCLGSRRDLQGAESPAPVMMEAAWKLRLARATSAQPIVAPLGAVPAQAWAEADRLSKEPIDPEAEIRRASMQRPELQFERIMPDGSRVNVLREGNPEADLVATGAPRSKVSTATPQARMLANRPQQFGNPLPENRDVIVKRIIELRGEQRLLQQRIDDVSRKANEPNLPRDQRQLHRQTIDGLETELAAVEFQINQLNQLRRNR